jgi:hypothetical protein
MASDASSAEPAGPRVDLFRLPEIVSVEAVPVRTERPLIRIERGREVAYDRFVELTVRTSAPIPERAYSPVLQVGDVEVGDYEAIGPTTYRFRAFEPERLQEGAPIHFAWPGFGPPRPAEPPRLELKEEERR